MFGNNIGAEILLFDMKKWESKNANESNEIE